MSGQQSHFDFEGGSASLEGYDKWLAGRQLAVRELAVRLGLPLGHQVEVWLIGGIKLRGRLHLQSEMLLIEEDKVRQLPLRIGSIDFTLREIESCTRLD